MQALELAVVVNVDGLALPRNPGVGTFGFVIYEGDKKVAQGHGLAGEDVTSNFSEYTALAEALKKLKQLGLDGDITVRSDSQLLVGQMSKGWKVKGGGYVVKLAEVKELMRGLGSVTFEWVPREQNEEADLLTRVAYEEARRKAR